VRNLSAISAAFLLIHGAVLGAEAAPSARSRPLRLDARFIGKVTDPGGRPVAGAEVLLRDKAGKVAARAAAGADGGFSARVAPGRYTLSVGGRLRADVLVVKEGGAPRLVVLLGPQDGRSGKADGDTDWLGISVGVVLFALPVGLFLLGANDDLSSGGYPVSP